MNCASKIDVDYTEEMVLNNFIRGHADEEIKSKIFALHEEDCTSESVQICGSKETGSK